MKDSKISKSVKSFRKRLGLSQEELARETNLNLRTIQRIENNETVPRGDSLRRLATALKISPEELIDWEVREDKSILTLLNLSQLSFLVFPVLGTVLPLIIWILKKDKTKRVAQTGRLILNFQITWVLFFFALLGAGILTKILHFEEFIPSSSLLTFSIILYVYNLLVIIINSFLGYKNKRLFYQPALPLLR